MTTLTLPVHDALVLLEVGILPLTRILPGHSFLVALGRPGGVDTCRKPLLRVELSIRRCRLRCREGRDRWLGRRAILRLQRWWRGSRRWKDDVYGTVYRRRLLHWCQRVLGQCDSQSFPKEIALRCLRSASAHNHGVNKLLILFSGHHHPASRAASWHANDGVGDRVFPLHIEALRIQRVKVVADQVGPLLRWKGIHSYNRVVRSQCPCGLLHPHGEC